LHQNFNILKMKVTMITGASGGIGEAFARELAAQKHNLLLVARSENKLFALCAELGDKYKITAQYIAVDLIKQNAEEILFNEVEKRDLEIDWLINNAGIGSGGDFLKYDLKSVIELMHLNMDSMVAITHRFLPQMRKQKRGTIINVGSMAGFGPIPYMNVYAASKGFVKAFTEALAEENRPFGIQTMLLCPGATETNFFEAARIGADQKSKNLETPEQVVFSALQGLKQKKAVTISGMQNKIGRYLLYFIPNSMFLPWYGKKMRAELHL